MVQQTFLNKLTIKKDFILYKKNNKILLVNQHNVKRIVLNNDEFRAFKSLLNIGSMPLFKDWMEIPFNKSLFFTLCSNAIIGKTDIVSSDNNIKPSSGYLGITDSCNYQCIYCFVGARPVKRNISMMTYTDGIRIIDQMIEQGFIEVIFTGGEPTLSSNLFDLAYYARKKGLVTGLLTNGSLINETNVNHFKQFHYVQLSLDGSTSTINDITRGSGHFDKTTRTIQLLKNCKINVRINTVVTKTNLNDIDNLLNLTTSMNIVTHTMADYIPAERIMDESYTLTEVEKEMADSVIYKTKLSLMQKGNYSLGIWDNFLSNGSIRKSCGAGISEIYFTHTGDVYPCRMLCNEKYHMGNILHENLREILSRYYSSELRRSLDVDNIPQCCNCSIRYLCGGACRAAHAGYTGSIHNNDELLCMRMKRKIEILLWLEQENKRVK